MEGSLLAVKCGLMDGTADWAAAEKAELPVMCFAPGRTSLLGPIAEQHPQLTLILDHMGLTAAMLKDNKVEEAVGQTVALGKYPNVSVKVSASPGISREPYPFRDVRRASEARIRRIRPATQPLGHRPHELVRQGELSPADHAFHGRVELS